MNLHQNRYGTFGSGPADRDQERLEHELFIERGGDLRIDPTRSPPHRAVVSFFAALRPSSVARNDTWTSRPGATTMK